jgi:hypothetical protein
VSGSGVGAGLVEVSRMCKGVLGGAAMRFGSGDGDDLREARNEVANGSINVMNVFYYNGNLV